MKESERIVITSDGFIWFRLTNWEARMCLRMRVFYLYALDGDDGDYEIDSEEKLERAIACGEKIVVEGAFLPSPLLEAHTKNG